MKKDLWDNVKLVHEGKVEMSSEEQLELAIEGYNALLEDAIDVSRLDGQADIFISGGKGLIGAGVVWLLIGKLGRFTAKKMAEQYKMD